MSIQEKIEEFRQKKAALEQELATLGEQLLKEETAKLFEKYKKLEAISWTQYTPYFNDGDSCEFRSRHHDPYITIDGLEEDYVTLYATEKEDYTDFQKVLVDFREIMQYLDNDSLLSMFGDHVRVTVTRDGIECDEHSHN